MNLHNGVVSGINIVCLRKEGIVYLYGMASSFNMEILDILFKKKIDITQLVE